MGVHRAAPSGAASWGGTLTLQQSYQSTSCHGGSRAQGGLSGVCEKSREFQDCPRTPPSVTPEDANQAPPTAKYPPMKQHRANQSRPAAEK